MRDPDVRHQLARTYRQGWSIYKRVLRTRSRATTRCSKPGSGSPTTSRTSRCIIVACVAAAGPCSPRSAPPRSTRAAFPAVQNLAARAPARAASAPRRRTLPLWSAWEARRTLGLPRRSPRSPSCRSAGPAVPAAPAPIAAGRQPRPPRPLRPPALSRPARPAQRAPGHRHNGCHDSRGR